MARIDLVYWISSAPTWLAVLVVVVIPTTITMCGPVVVRKLFGVERIAANNEVAGFKFATLGVIYAVLLGLVVVSVWEKYSEAEDTVTRESGAIAALFRLSGGLDPGDRQALRDSLAAYAGAAVEFDWPAMAAGDESAEARRALGTVYDTTLTIPVATPRDEVLLATLLDQVDLITDARRERLVLAAGVVPPSIWVVLFLGAALTLGFTFFFGLENLRAQVLMAGMLALVIFLALFVVVAVSHPFTGPISVKPEAILQVLEDFDPPPE